MRDERGRGEHRQPRQEVGRGGPRRRGSPVDRPRAARRAQARGTSAATPIISGSATRRQAAARQTSPCTWCPISCATTTSISSSRSVSTSVSESRIWRVRPRPASAACACVVSSPPRHSRTATWTPQRRTSASSRAASDGRRSRAQAAERGQEQRRRHRPGQVREVADGCGDQPPGAPARRQVAVTSRAAAMPTVIRAAMPRRCARVQRPDDSRARP